MYSMKNIDGKKSNTATAVNIVIEYNEFKDTLFSWKVVRHKIRRIQRKKKKNRKLVHTKSAKYLYHDLMIKDFF